MTEGGDPLELIALFQEVCDLPESQREARLQAICPDVSTREAVLQMVRADARPTAFDATGLGARVLVEELAEHPQRIGPYRVVALLGEGGMGRVYEVEQESPRRLVALKILHRELLSEAALHRFEQEGHLLARLLHPGIPQVYAVGVHEGRPYLAMERVQGQSITRFAAERGLELGDRVRLLVRVCDAVHHAHLRGVVHRDLKPANVLVASDGQPKVVDFGIAVDEGESGAVLAGTPGWMAPEQLGAVSAPVDPRTDVYALGALGWRMLTGEPALPLPWGGLDGAFEAVRRRPPSLVGRGGLPADLEWVLDKALAVQPGDRYPSAQDLGEELQRWLGRYPVAARPGGWAYRTTRLVQRQPLAAAAAVVVGLCIAGVVIGQAAALVRVEAARSEAESARLALADEVDAMRVEQARLALGRDPVGAVAGLAGLEGDRHLADAGAVLASAADRGLPEWVLQTGGEPLRHGAFVGPSRVVAGADAGVYAWNLAEGTFRKLVDGPADLRALAVREGQILAALPGPWLGGVDGGEQLADFELAGALGVEQGWLLATAEGELQLRDPAGQILERAEVGAACERLAELSPLRFGVGCLDGSVWVWAPPTAPVRARGHRGEVSAIATGEGGWFTGGEDGLLQAQDGSWSWPEHAGEVRALEVVGDRVLSADRAGVVRAFANGELAWEQQGHSGVIRCMDAHDRWLATGGEDARVMLWDVATGQARALLGHADRVRTVAFSPDGAWLLSLSEDGTARVWPVPPGAERVRIGPSGEVTALALAADGVAAGYASGSVRIVDSETGTEWRPHEDEVSDLDGGPLGWLSGGRDGSLARVGGDGLRQIQLGGPVDDVIDLGDVGLASSRRGIVWTWKGEDGPVAWEAGASRVRGIARVGEGVVVLLDEGLVVQRSASGAVERWAEGLDGTAIAPHADGVVVATRSGALVALPDGPTLQLTGAPTHLAASPGAHWLAAARGRDLWRSSGTLEHTAVRGAVRALAVSDEGEVVYALDGGEVRRWTGSADELVLQSAGEVSELAVRGRTLAVGGAAGVLVLELGAGADSERVFARQRSMMPTVIGPDR